MSDNSWYKYYGKHNSRFSNLFGSGKNVSAHTRVAYIADIQEFARFLNNNNFIKNHDEIINVEPENIGNI